MGESASRRRETLSDQALIEGTGAAWKTWLAILDERRAASLDHAAIARFLVDEYDIDGWWAQSITVGYEQERGMREPGQRPDGSFSASASKVVPGGPTTAFEWVADPERRAEWADDAELTQRSAAPPKSVRFDAADGSLVLFSIYPKGAEKTSVGVEIAKLPSPERAAEAKAAWKARLERLAATLAR